MALEVTSSAVSGLQKVAKPVEMPEQRSVERAADVSTVSTSAQIERQVATSVEQDATGGYKGNDEAQAAAAALLLSNPAVCSLQPVRPKSAAKPTRDTASGCTDT